MRILLAWIHLLALAAGIAGVWARARALGQVARDPADGGALKRAFAGDVWWGVAAMLWLATGLWRLFGATEKSTAFYWANHLFLGKLALFVLITVMEIWPMVTLIRWRSGRATPTPRVARRIATISYIQCALVVVIVLAAVSLARGYGVLVAAPAVGQP